MSRFKATSTSTAARTQHRLQQCLIGHPRSHTPVRKLLVLCSENISCQLYRPHTRIYPSWHTTKKERTCWPAGAPWELGGVKESP